MASDTSADTPSIGRQTVQQAAVGAVLLHRLLPEIEAVAAPVVAAANMDLDSVHSAANTVTVHAMSYPIIDNG